MPSPRSNRQQRPDSVNVSWGLSARELSVLSLVCDGLSNAEIAERLVISTRTVQSHVAQLLAKSEARNRTDLAVRAFRAEIVRLWPEASAEGGRR